MLIRLTRHGSNRQGDDGDPVWINADHIRVMTVAKDDDGRLVTSIDTGDSLYEVKEHPDEFVGLNAGMFEYSRKA